MAIDSFWTSKMQSYINSYKLFHKGLREIGLSNEDIYYHWVFFCERTCDCEGCREQSDCVIHIDVPQEDE